MAGQEIPASSILPKQTRDMSFLIPFKRGVYQIMFKAIISPLEGPIHKQEFDAAGIEAEEIVWQSSTYLSVG